MNGDETRCPSCGAELTGAFCASCGQRRLRPDEYSLSRLLRDGFQDFFSVDAKLLRSFRLLLTRPGELTRAYMEGRRGGLLGPFQLFIVANLIYFFVQPYSGFTGFNTPLISHMERQYYSEAAGIQDLAIEAVDERIDRRVAREAAQRTGAAPVGEPAGPYEPYFFADSWTVEDSLEFRRYVAGIENELYPNQFDARGEVNARSLVIMTVPLLALIVAGLHAFSGVPFVQHVVFSIHFMAWTMTFLMSLFLPFCIWLERFIRVMTIRLFGAGGEAWIFSPGVRGFVNFMLEQGAPLMVVLPYFYLSLRHVYERGRISSALRAVVLLFGMFAVTVLYRFLLFWVTYWAV